jgi:hypothetical protein
MACLQRQAVFSVPLDEKKCFLKLAYLVYINTYNKLDTAKRKHTNIHREYSYIFHKRIFQDNS